jgi:hypothetical protein
MGIIYCFTEICAKHFGSQIDTAQITIHLSSGSACIMDSVAAPLLYSADHASGPPLGCSKFLIQILAYITCHTCPVWLFNMDFALQSQWVFDLIEIV